MSSEQLNLQVVEIVRNWDANDPRQCKRDERRLRDLGTPAFETLIAMAQKEVRKRKLFNRSFLFLCVVLFLSPAVMSKIAPGSLYSTLFFIGYLIAFTICGIAALSDLKAVMVLTALDDPRPIGLMIESLNVPDMRPQLEDALIRLLPRIRPSNLHLLSPDQRKALYRTLPYYTNERLALTILQWLEQIGDDAAIPFVQKLAEPNFLRTPTEKVQKAAQECLPFLQEIAKHEQESDTLLRAAEGTEHKSGELLRPVSADTGVESRDLLRASKQEK